MTKSQRNQAENELIFKQRNDQAGYFAAEVLDADSRHTMLLNFVCECSDAHCHDKVKLSLADYRRIRQHDDRYVLIAGHQTPEIEHIVASPDENHVVVKKFINPTRTDGRLKPS